MHIGLIAPEAYGFVGPIRYTGYELECVMKYGEGR
jgi:hypothetical protein